MITTYPGTTATRIGTHALPENPRPLIDITPGGPGRYSWAIRDADDEHLVDAGAYASGETRTHEGAQGEAREQLVTVLRIILGNPASAGRRKEAEALLGVCGWDTGLANAPEWKDAVLALLDMGLVKTDAGVPGILLSPTALGDTVALAVMSKRTGKPFRRAGIPG
jgi:hypothetical protein